MHIDHQATLLGNRAQRRHAGGAVRHGAFEVRDAADNVDAPVESAYEVLRGGRRSVIAVLWKGDELQIDVRRNLALHIEQRVDGEQAVVANVDMAADGEKPARRRQIAIAQSPLDHGLCRELRLQLAPQCNALKQRARLVQPREPERKRRIHVEVAIDEGRGDEAALCVDNSTSLADDVRLDRDDFAACAGDINADAAIGECGVVNQDVEHAISFHRPIKLDRPRD